MSRIRDEVYRWTHGEDWRTWIAHAVIALGLAAVFSPEISVGYYLIRELEQILYDRLAQKPLKPLDHLMDVLAPAAAVYGIGALL